MALIVKTKLTEYRVTMTRGEDGRCIARADTRRCGAVHAYGVDGLRALAALVRALERSEEDKIWQSIIVSNSNCSASTASSVAQSDATTSIPRLKADPKTDGAQASAGPAR
jgi:hypothetical protein